MAQGPINPTDYWSHHTQRSPPVVGMWPQQWLVELGSTSTAESKLPAPKNLGAGATSVGMSGQ
jgi:hypothetical protein